MTRRQFAVVAVRLKEELNNIKTLLRELSDKGLVGSKKKIRALLPEKDTFTLRAVVPSFMIFMWRRKISLKLWPRR